MSSNIIYKTIDKDDFQAVIALGTKVHGNGYIDDEKINLWVNLGIKKNINSGFVAYDNDKLIGFRLTFAVDQWSIDHWCSPELWQVDVAKVCYFKCNTVAEKYRGYGIGSELLKLSSNAAKQQGAVAGVSHLWMQSPGNSAVKYFTKCGGKLVKVHPDRWNESSKNGYYCPVCSDPNDCHCSAAEMMVYFE